MSRIKWYRNHPLDFRCFFTTTVVFIPHHQGLPSGYIDRHAAKPNRRTRKAQDVLTGLGWYGYGLEGQSLILWRLNRCIVKYKVFSRLGVDTVKFMLEFTHAKQPGPDTMTNQQYVIRISQMMKISLIRPTKQDKGILAIDYSAGHGVIVVDATNWIEARKQIDVYRVKRANLK